LFFFKRETTFLKRLFYFFEKKDEFHMMAVKQFLEFSDLGHQEWFAARKKIKDRYFYTEENRAIRIWYFFCHFQNWPE